jgi:hypothetical protein
MSGHELIRRIVLQCERDKAPPHDGEILARIRELYDVSSTQKYTEHAEQQKEPLND